MKKMLILIFCLMGCTTNIPTVLVTRTVVDNRTIYTVENKAKDRIITINYSEYSYFEYFLEGKVGSKWVKVGYGKLKDYSDHDSVSPRADLNNFSHIRLILPFKGSVRALVENDDLIFVIY